MCQGEASFSVHVYGQYGRIVKTTSFYYVKERFFIVGIKVYKKSSFNRPKKQFPNSNYLQKQTLKSRIVLFKICKENHRVQSIISDVSFSIEFRLQNRLFCRKTLYVCTFARPHIFSTYNDIRSIVERTPHSHIQRYFCHQHDAHERICLSIFFCQHYCNSCSFLVFQFLL